MHRIWFMSPGTITAGNNVNLPSDAPPVDTIVSARVIRSGNWLADHTVDDHTLTPDTAVGGAVTNALGEDGAGNLETGAGSATGMSTCIDSHAIDSHSGADPKVSATATKVDESTITLNTNIDVEDIIELVYAEVGTRVKVA